MGQIKSRNFSPVFLGTIQHRVLKGTLWGPSFHKRYQKHNVNKINFHCFLFAKKLVFFKRLVQVCTKNFKNICYLAKYNQKFTMEIPNVTELTYQQSGLNTFYQLDSNEKSYPMYSHIRARQCCQMWKL